MPVATYKCTACDLSGWDLGTWGYRYYLYGELKVRMRVAIGWCHVCSDLGAVEVLPDAEAERACQQRLETFQTELDEVLAANPPQKALVAVSGEKKRRAVKSRVRSRIGSRCDGRVPPGARSIVRKSQPGMLPALRVGGLPAAAASPGRLLRRGVSA